MERDARYTAVGAFVILVTAMAALFVYWYSEGRDRRSYVPYEIYFRGSVTGLSEGGSVRYLGVEVGKVRSIRLDPRSATRVQVVVAIDQDTPVSAKTTAELSTLSIATGLLYIDLRQNTGNREVLPPVPSEHYPVINTVSSEFDTFLNSLPDLAGSLAVLLERAQQIFSPENSAALADMVKNLHAASEQLPATMRDVDALLRNLNDTGTEVRKLVAALQDTAGGLGPAVSQLVSRLDSTADNLDKASAGISHFIEENRGALSGFAQNGLPQLQRTIGEARDAVEQFRELARSLKENPSQLIYQPAQGGVEVPR
ncbi:MAG TPA: MlaD family protein [Steroidobacteraceae bacterium]|nr:MlaD family protein [Steroidobacteraceae bacterium]